MFNAPLPAFFILPKKSASGSALNPLTPPYAVAPALTIAPTGPRNLAPLSAILPTRESRFVFGGPVGLTFVGGVGGLVEVVGGVFVIAGGLDLSPKVSASEVPNPATFDPIVVAIEVIPPNTVAPILAPRLTNPVPRVAIPDVTALATRLRPPIIIPVPDSLDSLSSFNSANISSSSSTCLAAGDSLSVPEVKELPPSAFLSSFLLEDFSSSFLLEDFSSSFLLEDFSSVFSSVFLSVSSVLTSTTELPTFSRPSAARCCSTLTSASCILDLALGSNPNIFSFVKACFIESLNPSPLSVFICFRKKDPVTLSLFASVC